MAYKLAVGLDIGSSSVKLVQLKEKKGGHALIAFGAAPLPPEAIVDGAPEFRGRPIGDLVLKGKTAPIRAWEPLTEAAMQAPATQAYLAAFEALAAERPTAGDGFARVLDLAPEDPLARYHADRLARGGRGTTIVLDEK